MEKLGDNLGANIFILRNRAGLSQEKLGFEVGVSRQTVSKWELNQAQPVAENVKKICEALEVSSDQLYGKEGVLTQKDLLELVDQIKNEKENIIDINKIRKDLNIIEDIKNEIERVSKETKKKRKKKRIIGSIIVAAVLLALYASYSLYKYRILTDINNKVAQYENADNYYCEIKMYENEARVEHIFIWHKGDKTKVETISYNNVGHEIMHDIKYIDINNNEFVKYDWNTKETIKDNEIIKNANYKEIQSMYGYFPDIIRNNTDVILNFMINLNIILLKNQPNFIELNINKSIIQLDKNTYLPIMYKTEDSGLTKKVFYKTELNNVQYKDVIFNEDSFK